MSSARASRVAASSRSLPSCSSPSVACDRMCSALKRSPLAASARSIAPSPSSSAVSNSSVSVRSPAFTVWLPSRPVPSRMAASRSSAPKASASSVRQPSIAVSTTTSSCRPAAASPCDDAVTAGFAVRASTSAAAASASLPSTVCALVASPLLPSASRVPSVTGTAASSSTRGSRRQRLEGAGPRRPAPAMPPSVRASWPPSGCAAGARSTPGSMACPMERSV